jgi:hypothetical protein
MAKSYQEQLYVVKYFSLQSSHDIFGPDANGRHNMDGWASFYKQYPRAVGIFGLSRIGLSSKRNQALVYVELQHDLLGGSGRFFVLSKTATLGKFKSRS